MRRYLIVANQTLGGDDLLQAVRTRLDAGPAEFWVLVPATPLDHVPPSIIPMPVMGRAPTLPASPEEGRRVAAEKLQAELQRLRAVGATVDGEVGAADPLDAVGHTLADRQFDEVIVLTLPTHLSRWLHQDLPRRLEHRFHVPVTHVATAE
jgi:nucleotide-binding universal stress UspA family protein